MDHIQSSIEARSIMKDVRNAFPEDSAVYKAAEASVLSCELAWELIERDLDDIGRELERRGLR
jgi:hypothetical protein